MADNIALIKLEVQVADGEVKVDRLKSKLKELDKGSKDYELTVKRLQIAENSLSKTREKLSKSTEDLIGDSKKGLSGVTKSSGSATSSVLELGRVVQDSNYGIRGMANNITQLASQIGFTVKSAGSLKGALKDIGKAFLGPMGVIFLISLAVSFLERLEQKSNKAKKAIDTLNSTFGEESTKLMVLKSALEDSNLSLETKTELVEKANDEFKDLNITLDENGDITEETAKKIDLLSLSFVKNAKARAIAKLIQDEMVKQAKIEASKAGDNLKWYETAYYGLVYQIRGVGAGLSGAIKRDAKNQKEALAESQDTVEKYIDMLKDKNGDLAKFLFGDGGSGSVKKRSSAEILQDLYGIDTSEEAQQDYKDKLTEFFDFSNIDFNEQFNERLKLLDLSKQLGLITSEQYEQYRKDLDKEFSKHHVVTGIAPELDFTLSEGTRKGIEEFNKSVTDEIIRQTRLEEYDEYAKQLQKVLGSINDFLDSEFERQLTMEQNKTNVLNNELHQRLLNEKLSKDERKAIQNEIAQNDEKLRIKQQAIEKKKFKQQKAFNIAMATIDTFRAATGVLADTKGGSFARIAGMVAVISAGLLQVAAISRQKFQSSSASSPVRGGASGAGGGDGVGDRSFNFNLVGNTLGNQITDAIQGQFDQPLKAYVVSRDITSQQALDANIKGTASF